MAKQTKILSAIEVKNLKVRPNKKTTDYMVGGVSGLLLRVKLNSKSWVLKITIEGKRRSIGLGAYPDIPLKMAREKALELRQKVINGENPLLEKKEDKAKKVYLFSEVAYQFFETKIKPETKNEKHKKNWISSLENYVFPSLGDFYIKEIETTHVLNVLEPIWYSKTETAARIRQRLEVIFSFAMAVNIMPRGFNPATWKGNLEQILPKPSKIKKENNYPSLSPSKVRDFMRDLRDYKGISGMALEFLILTAGRSGEVRFAKWEEIDIKEKVWTIPAERMKANKKHRVPLSKRAIKILQNVPELGEYIFTAPRGGALSDMSMNNVIRKLDKKGKTYKDPKLDRLVVPHGFRSTFKEWSRQPIKYGHSGYTDELSELSLAHVGTDQTRAAYARDSLLEERRPLMEAWSSFCYGKEKSADIASHVR